METLVLSKNQFSKLKQLVVPDEISNTECSLYYYSTRNSSIDYILKIFNDTSGTNFGKKLNTINTLIDNKNAININEMILPIKLVIVDNKVVGYLMEYKKNNINLIHLLNNSKIDINKKISYLTELEKILTNIKYIEKFKDSFFIGDIHPGNFILDLDDKKIKSIDTDSYSINGIMQPCMPIQIPFNNFDNIKNKYYFNEAGLIIPNNNSELLFFILIFLNTISNSNINKLSINEYYDYINYLKKIGFSKNLTTCFFNIYSQNSNHFDKILFDEIPKDIEKADYRLYEYIKKRH